MRRGLLMNKMAVGAAELREVCDDHVFRTAAA
jgi:hypothetical protein